jgi:virginiamycin B lyase
MRRRNMVAALAVGAAFAFQLGLWVSATNAQSAVALTGKVSSGAEPAMEGVVVSAKRDGLTITVSVVTDETGRYTFPANRLLPGRYAISIRATGYDLDAPKAAVVKAGQAVIADLKLKPTQNPAEQLTNAEWLMSMPGSQEQKAFLTTCTSCHGLERIVRSLHDAEEFLQVFARMDTYYPGSTPLKPQRLVGERRNDGANSAMRREMGNRVTAEWLASINLSQHETWNYPLSIMPRVSGKSTRVIITEYDLPSRIIQPHDVMLDRDGTVWYSDFGQLLLGKMNTKTGRVTQYPIPETKKGFPVGTLNLELDGEDNPWVGVMYQNAIARFDKKTETFRTFSIPKEWDTDAGQLAHIALRGTPADGKVWIKNNDGNNIYRLDPVSDMFENLGSFKDPRNGRRIGAYGIHSDAQNNLYLLDFSAGNIVRIDAGTKNPTVYMTPTPNSRPRRGRVDAKGRLWFAEYQGNAIGMFDPRTEKFSEWKVPTPWSSPYDAAAGLNDEAWTAGMSSDRVVRLDIKTGEVTEYPLPRPTNIRRVHIDDAKSPGTLWIGSNHGASIVKVEPLD